MTDPAVEVRRVKVRDGRFVAFNEYGDPAGVPTMFFHGTPGNRIEPHLDVWGKGCGLRFIATDRPGFGASDFARRSLLDWACDIADLADNLALDKFAVAGVSG